MKYKKIVSFSLLPVIGFSSIFLTSCFGLPEKNVFVDPENGIDKNYLQSSQELRFISERSFSLEFDTISFNNNSEYKINGTGWIIAKQQDTNNYFIATNLHVASTIENEDQTYEYYENNQIKSTTGSNVIQSKVGFIKPTTNNFYTDRNGDISPIDTYVNVPKPKIVYDATEGWSNVEYNLNNQQSFEIKNPTSDFAVLEYDFSDVDNSLKDFLSFYNNNPTKFANTYTVSNSLSDINTYYMGGFPVKKMTDGETQACWMGLSNLHTSDYFFNGSLISSNYDSSGPAPEDSLKYCKSSSEKWFWNVSKDLTFSYASMGGGSSGSMVINQNDEVVGIYWGEIDFSNNESYAPADLLRTTKFSFENNKGYNQNFPAIDLIDSFVQKMHNENITLNDEINNL